MIAKSFLLGRVPMSPREFAFFVEIFELTKGPVSTYSYVPKDRKITRPKPNGGKVIWSSGLVRPEDDE